MVGLLRHRNNVGGNVEHRLSGRAVGFGARSSSMRCSSYARLAKMSVEGEMMIRGRLGETVEEKLLRMNRRGIMVLGILFVFVLMTAI